MDEGGTVTSSSGVIYIDHPEIEAGLATLAQRWGVTVEDALWRALRSELQANGIDPDEDCG